MSFELSKYQQDILNFVKLNNSNLLIDAKAGSGKTSTLILIARELLQTNNKCMFLSFNKSIVDELKIKIPELSSFIKTVHSLGLSFIKSYCYKKHNTNYEIVDMEIGKKKIRELCKQYYERYYQEPITKYCSASMTEQEIKDVHNSIISDFVLLCNFTRLNYITNFEDDKAMHLIATRHCHMLLMYEDVIPNFSNLVSAVLNEELRMFENPEVGSNGKYQYIIDFNDMIFFPVWYQMQVPYSLKDSLDTILVDETQDLSQLQQLFVKRLSTGSNRFIFVGDKNQSIYGFNGADTHAIDNIKNNFNPKELPLSICYRCPEKIVRLAQDNVPDIGWNKDREDKGVLATTTYKLMKQNIKAGDTIIGRRNRDLLNIYKDFTLNDKREVKFKNVELVNAIVKDIKQCIREYLQLYAKNKNIDRVAYEYMTNFCETNGIDKKSNLYNAELNNFIKNYVKDHKEEFEKKEIMKSHYTLDYLKQTMIDYKENGAYNFENDNILTVYYEIIMEFIAEYSSKHNSILVEDFIEYMNSFLNASLSKYDVPIISSVHSMKGGESDTIYIYNYPNFPYRWSSMDEDDEQQELNLQYVAITRAKKSLYLVLNDLEKVKDDKQRERMVENNKIVIEKIKEINELVDKLNAAKYNM